MPEFPPLNPIAHEPLSVVLLACNEAPHVEDVIARWTAYLESLARSYELILIDDGSTDGTPEVVEALLERYQRLSMRYHEPRLGIGAAQRTGLEIAQYPLVCTVTCDRQFRPEDLKLLLAEIDRAHLASGYRRWQLPPAWLRGVGGLYRTAMRLLFGLPLESLPGWLGWRAHGYRCIARILFGVRAQDVGCPFRLYRRSIFDRIPIQSDGEFAQVEILAKANFLGCLMTEVPVSYRPRLREPGDVVPALAARTRTEMLRVLSSAEFGPATPPTEPAEPLESVDET